MAVLTPDEARDAPPLPSPRRDRWQPLRSGVINLFHYSDEQFWYEDGRMLLRGNNGTGKSRVLALQLPFLFDAELSPTRMEPDRSPSKRPEWNLLLGGKHRDRLGYTWIEFGRADAEGQEHYLTLGCGLHAVEHRGAADAWFFMTTQRVTRDFQLVVDAVPLSKSRLAEVLGDAGQIFRTQGDYRRAVDERLFRLGSRYRPLIDLLIQLRVPQLSRDFDEKRMNEQLSGALPPLSVDVLTQVADAMRDLDEERERLEELRRSQVGVQTFRGHYARYLQIALKRRAIDVTNQHNRYEGTLRTINDNRRRLDEAEQAHDQAEQEQADAETKQKTIRATLDTLRSRPEMQDARRLEEIRQSCDRLQKSARQAETELERAREQLRKITQLVSEQLKQLSERANRAETRIETLVGRDVPTLVKEQFELVASHLVEDYEAAKLLTPTEKAIDDCVKGLATLRKLGADIANIERTLQHEIDRQTTLEAQVEESQETLQRRTDALRNTRAVLCEALVSWFDKVELSKEMLPPRHGWIELIEMAGRGDEVPGDEEHADEAQETDDLEANPLDAVAELVRNATAETLERISRQRQQLVTRLNELKDRSTQLSEQRQQLIDGVHQPPPPPHVRDPDVRRERQGGPFYELCEFIDEIPERERPNWEAALEASGLLDAWVTPDGRIDDPRLSDATLLAGEAVPNELCRLSRVLQPAEQLPRGMSPAVVAKLLSSIGCGRSTATAWVDRDGTWQVGPATGCWTKPEVQHLGTTAREQRRLRQIESLSAQINELEQERLDAKTAMASLDRDRDAARRESDRLPSGDAFIQSVAKRTAAADQLLQTQQRLGEQLRQVGAVRTNLLEKQQRRDQAAKDVRLFEWLGRLDSLGEAIGGYRHELEILKRDLQDLQQQRATLERSTIDQQAATGLAEERNRQSREASDELAAKEAQLQTLESTVGADVRNILSQIAEQENGEQLVVEELKSLRRQLVRRAEEKGQLQGRLGESQLILQRHESDRSLAIARVAHMSELDLAQSAVDDAVDDAASGPHRPIEFPESPWSPTRAVQIAKQVRSLLRDTPDSDKAWEQGQNETQVQFRGLEQALLPTGSTPQIQTQDELTVVTIPFQGVVCTPAALASQLAEEVRHREALITDRERELFENRLIGDIAQSLHRNIRDAHALCNQMNAEVESRPMSTGMRLRFRWRPIQDGPDELQVACRALLRQPSAMSDEDRTALGRFLQQRIQEARGRDDAGTWQQHLAEALDYRQWFAFDIERETDGRWLRLTRRTHGTGSGGERAVALIIPMLAALAAYYHSAHSQAPRIILMDEAFVGIDNEMRAKFMDMLVQFDLDFVMTSEREWGCYPTMPALAIYHLSARRGVDAVLPTRWVWNGSSRELSEVHELASQGQLFTSDL